MPGLRKRPESQVVAVLTSDLHLTLTPPPARAETQEQWLDRQAFYLKQLTALVERHLCPLVIAGDIFDDGWRPHRCPPELVNFAIKHLPPKTFPTFAVPGQHDLPHHNYQDIHKSAYWTLVESGAVKDLKPGPRGTIASPWLVLHGFPWGHPPEPNRDRKPGGGYLHLAVIHSYVWANSDTSYPGAPPDQKLYKYALALSGYDAAVFGDNHKGFLGRVVREGLPNPDQPVLNCGAFQRRRADEKDYQCQVGLLYKDGHVERSPLWGQKDDRWAEPGGAVRPEEAEFACDAVVKAIRRGGTAFDFHEAVKRELVGVRPEVVRYVVSALERGL